MHALLCTLSPRTLTLALCLMAAGPTSLVAAERSLTPCEKCVVSANEARNACIQTRGPQDKRSCDQAMSEAVKRCQSQPICKKPDAK